MSVIPILLLMWPCLQDRGKNIQLHHKYHKRPPQVQTQFADSAQTSFMSVEGIPCRSLWLTFKTPPIVVNLQPILQICLRERLLQSTTRWTSNHRSFGSSCWTPAWWCWTRRRPKEGQVAEKPGKFKSSLFSMHHYSQRLLTTLTQTKQSAKHPKLTAISWVPVQVQT